MAPEVAGEEKGCFRHVEECGRACLPRPGAAQAKTLSCLSGHQAAQLSASGATEGSAAAGLFRAVTFNVKFDSTDQP